MAQIMQALMSCPQACLRFRRIIDHTHMILRRILADLFSVGLPECHGKLMPFLNETTR